MVDAYIGLLFVWFYTTIPCQFLHELAQRTLRDYPLLQRYLVISTVFPLLFLGLLAPKEQNFGKGLQVLFTLFQFTRCYEALLDPALWEGETFTMRTLHIGGSFQDIRTRIPVNKDKYWKEMRQRAFNALMFGTLLAISLVVINLSQTSRPSTGPLRPVKVAILSFFGCMYLWCSLELVDFIANAIALQFGHKLPPLNDDPFHCESIRRFWAKSWDTVMQGILKRYVFTPLVKDYGATKQTAALVTFAASGFMHTLPLFIAGLDFKMTLSVMGYFLVQALLTAIEPEVVPKNASSVLKRLWVAGCIVVPSFLLTGPAFSLAGFTF